MPDETDNRPETIVPANANQRPGPERGKDADANIAPRQKLDKAVLSLARLIAREQFEALQAANDNKPSAGEKERLAADLAAISDASDVVELHPASIDAYRRKIAELQEALHSNEDDRREAINAIRSLVTSIEVIPREGRGKFDLNVNGARAELLNLPRRNPGEPPNTVIVVAEERCRQYSATTKFIC